MAVDIANHPGRNPEYEHLMAVRLNAQVDNLTRAALGLPKRRVPPLPNKYIPHIGAKQRAKGRV